MLLRPVENPACTAFEEYEDMPRMVLLNINNVVTKLMKATNCLGYFVYVVALGF